MKMPFGDYKGYELDECPNSLLRWVELKMKAQPPATVPPEKREEYLGANLVLKSEARRILRERRRNGVYIEDTRRKEERKQRSR